jgi:hypothetical protein
MSSAALFAAVALGPIWTGRWTIIKKKVEIARLVWHILPSD